MADVLKVGPDEDVGQIQARLARLKGRQIYLYLPKPNTALQQQLPLVLLRRTADRLGLDLTIVTRDSATRVMARNVGLPVRWRLGDLDDGKGKAEEGTDTHEIPFPFSMSRSLWTSLGLAAVWLVIGLAGAILVLPHATIVVVPQTTPLEMTIEIQADPDLKRMDVPAHRIPARRLEVTLQRRAQETTAAHRSVPDARARGTVVFVNQSETQVEVPVGTLVRTGDGSAVAFRTLESVTVPAPAGTTVRVPVEAVELGSRGNVLAYTIDTVDPSLGLPVAVVNDRPMTGGTDRQVGVVTEEQRHQLRDTLLERTRQEALQALRARLDQGEILVDESVEFQVVDESFSEAPGAMADAIAVDLQVRATGMAVDLDRARRLAEEVLRQQVPSDQVLVDAALRTEVGPTLRVEGDVAHVGVKAAAIVQAPVKEVDIKNAVRGRPIDEASVLLRERFPLATRPAVEVSRGWFGRMPWLPMRIDVIVQPDSAIAGGALIQ